MKKLKTIICLTFIFNLLMLNSALPNLKSNNADIENYCDNRFEKQ